MLLVCKEVNVFHTWKRSYVLLGCYGIHCTINYETVLLKEMLDKNYGAQRIFEYEMKFLTMFHITSLFTITLLLQLTIFAEFRFRFRPWSFIFPRFTRRPRVAEIFRFRAEIGGCPRVVRRRFLPLLRRHLVLLLFRRDGRRLRLRLRHLLIRDRWKIVHVGPGPRWIRFRVRRQHIVKSAR